jgi:dephospho-CoA kinase
MQQAAKQGSGAVAVVEAALTLEAGGKSRYDKIVVVTCRPEQKIARYAKRAGVPQAAAQAEVERRSKAQMPDAEKARLADYVIDNSGTLEGTRKRTEEIYRELKALAEQLSVDR